MCHCATPKMWRLERNVTFDSADWSRLLYNAAHSHTAACAHHGRWQCARVSLPHICFASRAFLHEKTVTEPPFYEWDGARNAFVCRKLSERPFFLVSLSHGAALVLVIHHRKFWPLCGMSKLYGGGLELSNHTLHSLARYLITYKGNATFSESLHLKMENSEKSYCQE